MKYVSTKWYGSHYCVKCGELIDGAIGCTNYSCR